MIDTTIYGPSFRITKMNVCVSLISAIIFGYLIALYFQTKEIESEVKDLGLVATRMIHQADGPYTLTL